MIIDLGKLIDEKFFGEVKITFHDGIIVLVSKTETFKFQNLNKELDLSAVVVLR